MIITDATGFGFGAEVNDNNQLSTIAESHSLQHHVSHYQGQAYQVMGSADIASGTVVVLHITNNDSDRDLVLTYIRHQVVDYGGTMPAVTSYLQAGYGRTYSSGGAAVTPTNMNTRSSNTADVTVYDSAPTLAGTATYFDRWYTKAEGDMHAWNKEGTVIIGKGHSFELSYVGDSATGIVFARVSFVAQDRVV